MSKRLQIVRLMVVAALSATLVVPVDSAAQVVVQVGIPLPVIEFEVSSPLVLVGPGLWVVPNSEAEIFYYGGWYWARDHGRWYRSHGRRHGWSEARDHAVPVYLQRTPPGHYRRYHPDARARTMAPRGWQKQEVRHSSGVARGWPAGGNRHVGRQGPPGQAKHWQQQVPSRQGPARGGPGGSGPGRGKQGGHGGGHGRGR